MSCYSIELTSKNNVVIPKNISRAVKKFCKEAKAGIYFEIYTHKNKQHKLSIYCLRNWWDYPSTIGSILRDNRVTQEMIDSYKWLKRNTTLQAICCNPCDNEYGPFSWEDFTLRVYNKDNKELLKEFKKKYNI